MPPAVTAVRMSGAAHRAELPLLVLGPSLGTSATALWSACARGLTDVFDVLAWDLPGHGHNRAVPEEPLTMAELARGVLAVVDDVCEQRGKVGSTFLYAGNSVGGAVGLQLLLDVPDRLGGAVLLGTGARLGDASTWADRIDQVERSGTAGLVEASAQRWFAPGFLARDADAAAALLGALRATDDAGYVQVCRALTAFDVRDRLGEVTAPVLAVAGADDVAAPPARLAEIADGVRDGRLVVLPDVAHLIPAEAPEPVAALLRQHLLGEPVPDPEGPAPDLGRDLPEVMAAYAAGALWERPGLDRRARALVTLTALLARGRHEELATQARAALQAGLTADEVRELVLQAAIHCGVSDAEAAFRVVRQVLEEPRAG